MSEVYPTTPVPNWPYDIRINWNTTISAFDSGKEQRRQKNLYPKYDVTLTYSVLTMAQMQTLWNFYQARKGTFEPFYFYSLESTTWSGCYLGIGDGTTTTFDIPGKSTSNVQIYVSGVALRATEEYTLLTGGGAGSSDRVNFLTAPAANALITCDFTGYLRIRCRFQEELSRSAFTAALYRTGIKLKGLSHI
jgi:hypothetical protein